MKYVANPVEVDAFEILQVEKLTPDLGSLASYRLRLDNGNQTTVGPDMCARMTPAVGDFLVIQDDGYVYLNPRHVFLRKYHVKDRPTLFDHKEG